MIRRIVMFSGGIGSWATAKRVIERHGRAGLTLLFADTLMEDDDLYRFVIEASAEVGGFHVPRSLIERTLCIPPLKERDARREHLTALAHDTMLRLPHLRWVSEGRDPWQVFFDVRFLGNTRVDPCSRVLKRELMRKWLDTNCEPHRTRVYLGIDWSEQHRFEGARGHWSPWRAYAPLCDEPYLLKAQHAAVLDEVGIALPRLYDLGFEHNNCGGFCIKAGQAHFDLLLRTRPEVYAYHEQREQELREYLDADVSILRDRTGGTVKPLTLAAFRERRQRQPELFDADEWGGCSCLTPGEYEGLAAA